MKENGESNNPTYTVLKYPGKFLPRGYQNFVFSKWMRSYRYGNDYIKLIDSDAYYEAYSNYIRTLIFFRPEATLRIAVLSEDKDVALGFSVIRETILDYIWVHKDCRHQGIGTHLLPEGIELFTHLTRTGLKLWATKLPAAKFNPFI